MDEAFFAPIESYFSNFPNPEESEAVSTSITASIRKDNFFIKYGFNKQRSEMIYIKKIVFYRITNQF